MKWLVAVGWAVVVLTVNPLVCTGDLDSDGESERTLTEYSDSFPRRKNQRQHTIYISKEGNFSKLQQELAELTREYVEIFFDTKTKIHRHLDFSKMPAAAKRAGADFGPQYLTTHILTKVLPKYRPRDAFLYLALTSHDLWPGDGFNFVMGHGLYRQGFGVWSLARFGDERALLLRRMLTTATHELTHMLTLGHCTREACLMNNSDSVEDSDTQPMHLCSDCERKVQWNLQFQSAPRKDRLREFLKKNGLAEDSTVSQSK